jgi:hypothetical protein|tara:strand:- start:192 stop:1241 length:1050 start_codon:yes stop_codon:yes gene_type:complete
MGVPKPIEFWVDSLSSLIRDGLLMMVSSDNTSEYFDGEDVQEKATSLGWNTSSEDFIKFPLAEPKLKLDLVIVPDKDIRVGDDYINNASFDTADMDIRDATFDDGTIRPLLVGGTITIEISIPQSSYDSATFVELFDTEIKPYVESVLFHELTHVYEFYNRLLTSSLDPSFENLSSTSSMINKMGLVDDWDELMFLIYLHLSFELNARVSEVYGLIRNKNIRTKKEFLDFLKTSRAFSYAKRLRNFKSETYYDDFEIPQGNIDRVRQYDGKETPIEEIKEIVLQQLVDNWVVSYKQLLDDFSDDETLSVPTLPSTATSSPQKFLKFWEKRFNRAGEDSIRKISKLYSLL